MSATDERTATTETIKSETPATIGTLELTNHVGMRMAINVASPQDAYTQMRKYGAAGWTSGDIPPGGYTLPYDMADKFDFSLIGANEGEIEGEKGLWHKNQFYKRREMEEETKGQKKAALIKYSRGGRPTDPPHLKEGATGDKPGYVTLISFRGKARNLPALCKPGVS